MSHLTTDWLCVATEGDTVDKRTLERQWLIDAAELYDARLWSALIWPEHCKDYGNFGEVLEAMYQEGEDGLVRLYVRLCPNQFLLDANRCGQLLYFSVELTPDGNWRNTGRTYLEGLAVTDTPASVGTTRLRFSKRNTSTPGYYGYKITRAGKIEQVKQMNKDWQSWFGIKPKKFEEQPPEETPGDDDKLQVLANALNDLETRVGAIEEKLNATAEDVEQIAEVVDTQEFATLRDNLPKIITNFGKLDNKVTTLPKRDFGKKEKDKRFKFI
ncbi:GPO family capsid scaffolding protein [Kosakonia sacchari]|uniref:GPO family capsid scaffolding protein n=1 Tax=Kosakonia sacchari TaxID=1158459 RepID=UPI0013628AB5|nr:GPO family capsid scaffolding protein [Kosakonia sacchari]QHM93319.1 phage capsid protein [Kosakonia sacchari]